MERARRLWASVQTQELRGRERARRESRHVNRALKVIDSVDSHSDGCVARSMWSKANLRRPFLNAIHIVPELFAVVHGGDTIPGAQWMEGAAIHECLAF